MKQIRKIFILAMMFILSLAINVNADSCGYSFKTNAKGELKVGDEFEVYVEIDRNQSCYSTISDEEHIDVDLLFDNNTFELVNYSNGRPYKLTNMWKEERDPVGNTKYVGYENYDYELKLIPNLDNPDAWDKSNIPVTFKLKVKGSSVFNKVILNLYRYRMVRVDSLYDSFKQDHSSPDLMDVTIKIAASSDNMKEGVTPTNTPEPAKDVTPVNSPEPAKDAIPDEGKKVTNNNSINNYIYIACGVVIVVLTAIIAYLLGKKSGLKKEKPIIEEKSE